MMRKALCLAGVLFFMGGFLCALGSSPSRESEKPGVRSKEKEFTVEAEVDEDCRSRPGRFQVPAGKTARGFQLVVFEPGKDCKSGGEPENRGFSIRDEKNRAVYMWSQYRNREPYEKGGPLEKLELKEGDYTLSVAGGRGARVKLGYRLE